MYCQTPLLFPPFYPPQQAVSGCNGVMCIFQLCCVKHGCDGKKQSVLHAGTGIGGQSHSLFTGPGGGECTRGRGEGSGAPGPSAPELDPCANLPSQ